MEWEWRRRSSIHSGLENILLQRKEKLGKSNLSLESLWNLRITLCLFVLHTHTQSSISWFAVHIAGDGDDGSYPWKQPLIAYLPREITAGPINLDVHMSLRVHTCVCVYVCSANLYCCSCTRGYELVKSAALMISTAAWCGLTRYLHREVLESGRENQRRKHKGSECSW